VTPPQGAEPVMLSAHQHQTIFNELIVPTWTTGATRQDQPVVVFVAGQPGSGKTSTAEIVHQALAPRGGAVRISSDLYKDLHPAYADLLAHNIRTAGAKVRPDTRRWQAALEAHSRDHRFDTVIETALDDIQEFRAQAAAYRHAGYRIEVLVLATAEAHSQLGILHRDVGQALAGGAVRRVSWHTHDTTASSLLETLTVIDTERLADHVVVARRDLQVLYANDLVAGAWRQPPAAAKALAAERTRWWGAAETARFRRELTQAEQDIHHEQVPEDQRLIVHRDAERAFALSETVRRTAQAHTAAPGVDYHRLSHRQHRWIFDELIAPPLASRITPSEHPRAIYVVAQQGAGKTQTAHLVLRAMNNMATHIVGDDFKAHHPDYLQLLEEAPRTAGARIRADYQAWQAEAEALVRARRGDVVIESAPASAQQFLTSALPFHTAGYRVELVVLAVRAADSRQGTAHRYSLVHRNGVPDRFTTASDHDTCYRAIIDSVQAADHDQVADSVVVVRRDAVALYSSERGPHAPWAGPTEAARAVEVERLRPYTDQEAAAFLAEQRRLRTALPQYRQELEQIADLARPLLPPHLQPLRLARPAPPALLPAAASYSPLSSWSRAA